MEGIFRRRNLPHWDVDGHPYFITGCLHGSLSHSGMLRIEAYRQQLQSIQRPANILPETWDNDQQKRLFAFIDRLLDNESPIRHFQDNRLAEIVVDAFRFFDGVRYNLLAYVVMPSHHHWLFAINSTWAQIDSEERTKAGKPNQSPREVITQSIQSYTALKCNRLLGRTGRFWQQETFDHWVRNDDELHRIQQYIENNPVRAGLVERPQQYRWSSAFRG
jgi:putative transposase